jgi:hypothetical protein
MEINPTLAISGLQSVLSTLLSGAGSTRLLLVPERTAPVGLGGFVGMNRSPLGEVGGVRVDALARVAVEATSRADLDVAAQAVIATLLGTSRSALVPVGIQRINLVDSGIPENVGGNRVERTLSFGVVYEFQQAPNSVEGTIEQVPIGLQTFDASTGAIVDADFMVGSLAWFEVVDDPRAVQNGPSAWTYNVGERWIEQRSNIHGGQNIANANKAGTYLVLRTTPTRPAVRDFVVETAFRSEDPNGGIGFVFRYQNPFNFYFFLMDPAAGYRLMARKIDGSFSQLEDGGLDDTASFATNTDTKLRLEVSGPEFSVFLDDGLILTGRDTTIVVPGRVGFMVRRNNRAFFRRIRVVPT